jgi:hypothetical protein
MKALSTLARATSFLCLAAAPLAAAAHDLSGIVAEQDALDPETRAKIDRANQLRQEVVAEARTNDALRPPGSGIPAQSPSAFSRAAPLPATPSNNSPVTGQTAPACVSILVTAEPATPIGQPRSASASGDLGTGHMSAPTPTSYALTNRH